MQGNVNYTRLFFDVFTNHWPKVISTETLIEIIKSFPDVNVLLRLRDHLTSRNFKNPSKFHYIDLLQPFRRGFTAVRNYFFPALPQRGTHSPYYDKPDQAFQKSELTYVTYSEEFNHICKTLDTRITELNNRPVRHVIRMNNKYSYWLLLTCIITFATRTLAKDENNDANLITTYSDPMDDIQALALQMYGDFLLGQDDLSVHFTSDSSDSIDYSLFGLINAAIIDDNEDMVLMFIKNGANLNKPNHLLKIEAPLHVACREGLVSMVSLLVDNGADVNLKGVAGTTPLHEAVNNNHPDIVTYLLQKGADVTILDDNEFTPFMRAMQNQKYPLAKKLYEFNSTKSLDYSVYKLYRELDEEAGKFNETNEKEALDNISKKIDAITKKLDLFTDNVLEKDMIGYAYLTDSMVHLHSDKHLEAISYLESALDFSIPRVSYFRYYFKIVDKVMDHHEGLLEKVLTRMKKAITIFPTDPVISIFKEKFSKFNLDKKTSYSNSNLMHIEDLSNTDELLAMDYLKTRNYKEALSAFHRALQEKPNDEELLKHIDWMEYFIAENHTADYLLRQDNINIIPKNQPVPMDLFCPIEGDRLIALPKDSLPFDHEKVNQYMSELQDAWKENNLSRVRILLHNSLALMPLSDPYFNIQLSTFYHQLAQYYHQTRTNLMLAKKFHEMSLALTPNVDKYYLNDLFAYIKFIAEEFKLDEEASFYLDFLIKTCHDTLSKSYACSNKAKLTELQNLYRKTNLLSSNNESEGSLLSLYYLVMASSTAGAILVFLVCKLGNNRTPAMESSHNDRDKKKNRSRPQQKETIDLEALKDSADQLRSLDALLKDFKENIQFEFKNDIFNITINEPILMKVASRSGGELLTLAIDKNELLKQAVSHINMLYEAPSLAKVADDKQCILVPKSTKKITSKKIGETKQQFHEAIVNSNVEYISHEQKKHRELLEKNLKQWVNEKNALIKEVSSNLEATEPKIIVAADFMQNQNIVTKKLPVAQNLLSLFYYIEKKRNLIKVVIKALEQDDKTLETLLAETKKMDIADEVKPDYNHSLLKDSLSLNKELYDLNEKLKNDVVVFALDDSTNDIRRKLSSLKIGLLTLHNDASAHLEKEFELAKKNFNFAEQKLQKEQEAIAKEADKKFRTNFQECLKEIIKKGKEAESKRQKIESQARVQKFKEEKKSKQVKKSELTKQPPKQKDVFSTSAKVNLTAEDASLMQCAIDHMHFLSEIVIGSYDLKDKIPYLLVTEGLQDCIFKIMRSLAIIQYKIPQLAIFVENTTVYGAIANRILHENISVLKGQQLLAAAEYLRKLLDKPLTSLKKGHSLFQATNIKLKTSWLCSDKHNQRSEDKNYFDACKISIRYQTEFIRYYLMFAKSQLLDTDLLSTALQASLHIIRCKSNQNQSIEKVLRKYKIIDSKLHFKKNSLLLKDANEIQNFCQDMCLAVAIDVDLSNAEETLKQMLLSKIQTQQDFYRNLNLLSESPEFPVYEKAYAKCCIDDIRAALMDLQLLGDYSFNIKMSEKGGFFDFGVLHCAMRMLVAKIGQGIKNMPTSYSKDIRKLVHKDLLITINNKPMTRFEHYREQVSHTLYDETDLNNNSTVYAIFNDISPAQLLDITRYLKLFDKELAAYMDDQFLHSTSKSLK